jgi:hypothetical protein
MDVDENALDRLIEAKLAAYSQVILGQVFAMLGERMPPIAREGNIVSYDPSDGSVEVSFGDGQATITGPSGDGDAVPNETHVPLITNHHGDQAGPVGGERCILIPTQSGYAAHIIYDEDDSPGAPAGERWITHRDPTTGNVDCFIKLTNAGSLTNDGKGGVVIGFGELAEIETIGGHAFIADDNAKTITIVASDGTTKMVLDANTGSLLFQGATNATADGLVRQSDLVELLSQIQSTLQTFFLAHVSNGSGNAGPTTLTSIIPTASTKSFTA